MIEPKVDGRRVRGDKSRAEILGRAIETASLQGLEAITLGKLAETAGVSKANLTVLFGDKVSLQIAILDEAVRRFAEAVIEPARAKPQPFERVKALCEGWFTSLEEPIFAGGCILYSTMHEYRARPGAIRERALSYFETWRKIIHKELRNSREAGEIAREIDVDRVVFALMAYQNAAHLALRIGDGKEFDYARSLTRAELERITAKP